MNTPAVTNAPANTIRATRDIAIRRMRRALGEFTVEGIKTTIPLQSQILTTSDFQNGQYDITWVENFLRQEGLKA